MGVVYDLASGTEVPDTSVLFIDDDPELLAGLERALRPWRADYEMLFVCGGSAGLSTLQRRPVDVVVTDMAMPMVDGGELIDRARKLRPETAFIVLSGHCAPARVDALTHDGVVYLGKPAAPEVVMEMVEDAVDWLATMC
jgi:CheY-like chemotaxis protein